VLSRGRHSDPALAPYLNSSRTYDSGTGEPVDVVDRLLWRDAQQILARHSEDGVGHCLWCGRDWPCLPRRCAERADAASRQPWTEAWTARHDLHIMRTTPDWPTDTPSNRPRVGWHRVTSNRGTF
jgi:hypothetical protein